MAKQKPEVDRRFARFGVVSFTATTKVNDFVDYLEKGVVAGTHCKTCGARFFPPRADCHNCLDRADMEWFEVKGTGALMTYSILRYAPVGFEADLPYAIAVADYGDFKVFGRLKGFDSAAAKPGAEVATVVKILPENRYTFEFVIK